MTKIYISGPAAFGKTYFVDHVQSKYGITNYTEIMRKLHKVENFNKLSFLEKQALYLLYYIELNNTNESFISDRSVLDVLAWTPDNFEFNSVFLKMLELQPPTLQIILFPPELDDFTQHIYKNFITDPIRVKTHCELWKIDITSPKLKEPEFVLEKYNLFSNKISVLANSVGWKYNTAWVQTSTASYHDKTKSFYSHWQNDCESLFKRKNIFTL